MSQSNEERFCLQLMDRMREAWTMRWPQASGQDGDNVMTAFWVQGFVAGMRYAVHNPKYTGYAARKFNLYAVEKKWPLEPFDYVSAVIGSWVNPHEAVDVGDFAKWAVEKRDRYQPERGDTQPIKPVEFDIKKGEVLWRTVQNGGGDPATNDLTDESNGSASTE